ncbi:hypothetical protein [Rhodoferax sp.]|uniref:hypothetical protein n=1 Tax=Rhodoferax sp. TaxID=50421 RepID=UPI0026285914|nr:hypothetical protein [Rhodoferax sp.]MDD2926231.1 hypothetical protein [Rhodoferax sp.]
MNKMIKTLCTVAVLAVMSSAALAKLPAPSDEAKAKAEEAKAKTAWAGKVDAFKLCKAQDAVVAHYKKAAPAKKGAAAASGCTDPGPFVYTPNVPAVSAAPAPAVPASVAVAKKP